MVNPEIMQMVKCKKLFWPSSMINGKDSISFRELSLIEESSFRSNFGINDAEELIYCRETSCNNKRNQGIVVTDWGVHCIPINDSPERKLEFAWAWIENVVYENGCWLFRRYGEESDDNYYGVHWSLFSKENPGREAIDELTKTLNIFCSLASSH